MKQTLYLFGVMFKVLSPILRIIQECLPSHLVHNIKLVDLSSSVGQTLEIKNIKIEKEDINLILRVYKVFMIMCMESEK